MIHTVCHAVKYPEIVSEQRKVVRVGRSFWRRRAEQRIEEARDSRELQRASEGEQADGTTARQTPRGGIGGWRSLVEQRIQDGIERGLFDNLKGAGKPLNLDEDALVPEDMRMAFRLLRSNGLAPLWVELNREIRDDLDRLQRFREHVHERWDRTNTVARDHFRRDYISRVHDINGKILNYNILAPSPLVHLRVLILSDELAKFDAAGGP